MLTPEQCRAARAWLDWGQAELAKRANVGLSTLRDFEAGKRTPMRNNLDAIRAAFHAAGVEPTFAEDRRASGISARPVGRRSE